MSVHTIGTEEAIINTVGKHFIDLPMGTAFFHDVTRMHHDALMDGATLACDKIFGVNELYPVGSGVNDSGGDEEATWKAVAITFIVGFVISLCVNLRQKQLYGQSKKGDWDSEDGMPGVHKKVEMEVQDSTDSPMVHVAKNRELGV